MFSIQGKCCERKGNENANPEAKEIAKLQDLLKWRTVWRFKNNHHGERTNPWRTILSFGSTLALPVKSYFICFKHLNLKKDVSLLLLFDGFTLNFPIRLYTIWIANETERMTMRELLFRPQGGKKGEKWPQFWGKRIVHAISPQYLETQI